MQVSREYIDVVKIVTVGLQSRVLIRQQSAIDRMPRWIVFSSRQPHSARTTSINAYSSRKMALDAMVVEYPEQKDCSCVNCVYSRTRRDEFA